MQINYAYCPLVTNDGMEEENAATCRHSGKARRILTSKTSQWPSDVIGAYLGTLNVLHPHQQVGRHTYVALPSRSANPIQFLVKKTQS